MVLPLSVTRERSISTLEPHPLPSHTSQPPADGGTGATYQGPGPLKVRARYVKLLEIFKSWDQNFPGERVEHK